MKTILPISIAALFLFAPAIPSVQKLLPNQENAPSVPFHTPAHTEGRALPSHIEKEMIIGPEDGIILMNTMVRVEKNGSLVIKPGTTIAATEYAGIRVFGKLEAQGTEKNPIRFISNELNETNRTWSGILYENSGSGIVEHTTFHHASPSISCTISGKVITRNNKYLFGNLALYGPC